MALLDRILRAGEGKKVKALADIVPDINAQEPEIHALSDQALKGKTAEFRSRIERGEDTGHQDRHATFLRPDAGRRHDAREHGAALPPPGVRSRPRRAGPGGR